MYSERFKEKLLAKALVPSANISSVARKAGVPKQTLFAGFPDRFDVVAGSITVLKGHPFYGIKTVLKGHPF